MPHCTSFYEMDLIYVQTRLKGRSSPELALKRGKKKGRKKGRNKVDNLLFIKHLGLTCTIVFMNVLGLDR